MLSSAGHFDLNEAVMKCLLLFLENSPLPGNTVIWDSALRHTHVQNPLARGAHTLNSWEGHNVSFLRVSCSVKK